MNSDEFDDITLPQEPSDGQAVPSTRSIPDVPSSAAAFEDVQGRAATPSQVLRLPPHSIEAESSVLGGLLLDNSAWDISEAHEAIVRVTSKIDPDFREEHKIENNWLLVPEKESQEEDYVGDFNYHCWILGNSESAWDHPVNALATFNDQNDRYMEEWETDAKSQWDNVLAVLRKEHLSETVNRVISSAYPQFSEENLGQLVMVRLSQDHLARSDEPDAYCKPRVDVMPVGEGMLERICEQLERQTGVRVNATQMANIVWHAVRPGELIDGPRNGAFHQDSVLVAPSP